MGFFHHKIHFWLTGPTMCTEVTYFLASKTSDIPSRAVFPRISIVTTICTLTLAPSLAMPFDTSSGSCSLAVCYLVNIGGVWCTCFCTLSYKQITLQVCKHFNVSAKGHVKKHTVGRGCQPGLTPSMLITHHLKSAPHPIWWLSWKSWGVWCVWNSVTALWTAMS